MNDKIKMEHDWVSVYDFVTEAEFNSIDATIEEVEGDMNEQII